MRRVRSTERQAIQNAGLRRWLRQAGLWQAGLRQAGREDAAGSELFAVAAVVLCPLLLTEQFRNFGVV